MLYTLAERAWRVYTAAGDPCVIKPAIPILYFGDSARYRQSPRRIITVGLNPSRAEFPDGGGLRRFPAARPLARVPRSGAEYARYLGALDAYFRTAPYATWFGSYEPLLRGLRASYYDDGASVALHTDICSPLATDPTWSGLPPASRATLEPDGAQLWRDLVDALAPDIIVASVAQEHLRKITPAPLTTWGTVCTLDRPTPYRVRITDLALSGGKRAYLIFGTAAQTPFGTVSTGDKRRIGAEIGRWVGAT